MENVSNQGYLDAQQAYGNLAKQGSTFNNFGSQLMGFDATYQSYENLAASKMQNEFNSLEAAKNRNWQEYMSNTANQRAVKDLKEAGFSPLALLANGSSASTPSGSAASSSGGGSAVHSKSGDLMRGIMSMMVMLGMSSARNAIAKNNLEASSKMNSANIAAKQAIAKENNLTKLEAVKMQNEAKDKLARMTRDETEDLIKVGSGWHKIKHSRSK